MHNLEMPEQASHEPSAGDRMDMSLEEMRKKLGGREQIEKLKREGLAAQKEQRKKQAQDEINSMSPSERIEMPIEKARSATGTPSPAPKKSLWERLWGKK